jgi:hypothetical protein
MLHTDNGSAGGEPTTFRPYASAAAPLAGMAVIVASAGAHGRRGDG